MDKKKRNDLPQEADNNRSENDVRNKQQEEFDNTADSQQNHERMIPSEHKKQSEKQDRVDRKLPQVKK
ncbi:MAG TPA: hypothetical protein VJT83_08715 [Chitinophagaceae bacterium]|nr:hypothetical protein [Chitinophagaceae bacterium]